MSFFRVLPTPTRRVLRRISQALKGGPEEVRDGVRLVGGTALALHLGHRRSHDVDPWVPVEVRRTSTGARMTEAPEAVPARVGRLNPA